MDLETRRLFLTPLFWYIGVALAVPFSNGGYARESYYHHAASVLAMIAPAAAAAALVAALAHKRKRRTRSS